MSFYKDVRHKNPYVVGDHVYLRPSSGRCDREWLGPFRVTKVVSSVSVILNDNNVPRHISHVRRVPHSAKLTTQSNENVKIPIVLESCDANEVIELGDNEEFVTANDDLNVIRVHRDANSRDEVNEINVPILRKSSRRKALPVKFRDYVMD